MLAHLHSVRGRRGRSLYDRGTGSCRRSWHRSGRRRGRKSTRQCLCREKDKLLETLQTVQPITTQETSFCLSRHTFPFSSLVLYCIHCLSWIAMGQITCHNNKKKWGWWWGGLLRGRHFCFSAGIAVDLLEHAVFYFNALKWNVSKYFEITSCHSRRPKKFCFRPDNRGSNAVFFFSLLIEPANHFSFSRLNYTINYQVCFF